MWKPIETRAARPLSNWTKVAFFFAGVVLPIVCFLLAAEPFQFTGDWQSGNLNDQVCYLLGPPASLAISPVILYPMLCLTLVMLRESVARHFLVRLGVYSAALPAIQYAFVLYITIMESARFGFQIMAAVAVAGSIFTVVGIAGWVVWRWVVPLVLKFAIQLPRRVRNDRILIAQWIALLVGTAAILVAVGYLLGEELLGALAGTFGVMLLLSLAAAPFWALSVYVCMSIRLYLIHRHAPLFLRHILAVISYVAAYLALWRWGVQLALAEYAKLPTEDPGNCYICTAAARGHRRWVGARDVALPGGGLCRVNDQMRYLKCSELALAAIFPSLHRRLRRTYNWLGPPLAARMSHRLVADLAYAALKPPEWLLRWALRLLVPDFDKLARETYCLAKPRNRISNVERGISKYEC